MNKVSQRHVAVPTTLLRNRRPNVEAILNSSAAPQARLHVANPCTTANTMKSIIRLALPLYALLFQIRAFAASGELDTSFDAKIEADYAEASGVQPDGKVVVGGRNMKIAGEDEYRSIARFNSDGTLDRAFNPPDGFIGIVGDLAVQPDGKIVLLGDFGEQGVIRLNGDGTLDRAFRPILFSWQYVRIYPQIDGKLYCAGIIHTFAFGDFDGQKRVQVKRAETPKQGYLGSSNRDGLPGVNILRLNADGTLDTSFDPGNIGAVTSIAIQPDGRPLVASKYSDREGKGNYNAEIQRISVKGTADSSFNCKTKGFVSDMAVQADGKVVIVGEFERVNGEEFYCIARLNNDGSVDSGYDPKFEAHSMDRVTLQPDGKALVAGAFRKIGDAKDVSGIIRLNVDGTLDSSFPGTYASSVRRISVQEDGSIIVGGQCSEGRFGSQFGVGRAGIARLHK